MTPEQLQELEEKAKLWDSLSPLLKTIHGSKFKRPKVIPNLDGEITENGKPNQFMATIPNTSNSSSHIGLLQEEFGEHLCSCNFKKCECLTQNNFSNG